MLHATINAHIRKKEVNMKKGVSDEIIFCECQERIRYSKTSFAPKYVN